VAFSVIWDFHIANSRKVHASAKFMRKLHDYKDLQGKVVNSYNCKGRTTHGNWF